MQLSLKNRMTSNGDAKGLSMNREGFQFTAGDAECRPRAVPSAGTRALFKCPALVGAKTLRTAVSVCAPSGEDKRSQDSSNSLSPYSHSFGV